MAGDSLHNSLWHGDEDPDGYVDMDGGRQAPRHRAESFLSNTSLVRVCIGGKIIQNMRVSVNLSAVLDTWCTGCMALWNSPRGFHPSCLAKKLHGWFWTQSVFPKSVAANDVSDFFFFCIVGITQLTSWNVPLVMAAQGQVICVPTRMSDVTVGPLRKARNASCSMHWLTILFQLLLFWI